MNKKLLLIPVFCALFVGCDHNNVNVAPPSNTVQSSDDSEPANQMMDQSTSDQQISQSVSNMLMNDSTLSNSARNIQVSTMNGNVTLQGTVASRQEKNKVVSMVRSMQGVGSVDSTLLMIQP